MGILFALIAAATYGTGDFFGGLAAKRHPVWIVVTVSGFFGLLTALAAVLITRAGSPPIRDLELGALTGAIGAGGIACLYRGLAVGRMSIVAPITAVVAAVVPVLFGFARGERPGAAALTGVALALIAVALVSSSSDEDVSGEAEPGRRGIVEALAAGLGFGLLYVVLSETTRGMWPLVAARVVSTAIALAIAALSGGVRLRAGRPLRTMALSGVFDMLGNVFYLTALRQTLIIVAAVITSLYPASTVVLARAVLREQLTMAQWCGVACAGLGVVLIALG